MFDINSIKPKKNLNELDAKYLAQAQESLEKKLTEGGKTFVQGHTYLFIGYDLNEFNGTEYLVCIFKDMDTDTELVIYPTFVANSLKVITPEGKIVKVGHIINEKECRDPKIVQKVFKMLTTAAPLSYIIRCNSTDRLKCSVPTFDEAGKPLGEVEKFKTLFDLSLEEYKK